MKAFRAAVGAAPELPRYAVLTAQTENKKLTKAPAERPVSVTRAAQVSCPRDCPLLDGPCYGETGTAGFQTRRANRAAADAEANAQQVAIVEAKRIASQWPRDGRPLRLHEVGDAATSQAAQTLASGVCAAQAQGAGFAFTYTHAWRRTHRADWGPISVLASCESPEAAAEARAAGWAPAIIYTDATATARELRARGLRLIQCPEETGAAPDCASCGLCMRDDALRAAGSVIGFTPHGSGARKLRAQLGASK